MSEPRFAGQVALVTGASQGLGRAIALALAREQARVVLAARSREGLEAVAREVEAAGGDALVAPADVGDPESVDALRTTVDERWGTPDVLVCNSGVAGPTAVLWEQDPADWDATFGVNVGGVFLRCRAFLPGMVERGSGSVVIIGSMTGKRPLHARTPYAASKTALTGLVRTLAWEAGAAGVRVNLISPGPVAGERLEGVIARQAAAKGISEEESRRLFTSASPLDRFVEADDVAAAVLFLASDAAASITGEDLNVSAGSVTHG